MRTIVLRISVFSLLALGVVSLMPSTASAEIYCMARSPNAWGEGWSPRMATARRIALAECAVRTPRGQVCFITACS